MGMAVWQLFRAVGLTVRYQPSNLFADFSQRRQGKGSLMITGAAPGGVGNFADLAKTVQ
jgi:hypothetical protein